MYFMSGEYTVGEPLKGHTDSVQSVACSPDGRHIVFGSRDRTIWVWVAQTGAAIAESLKRYTNSVQSVAEPVLASSQIRTELSQDLEKAMLSRTPERIYRPSRKQWIARCQ